MSTFKLLLGSTIAALIANAILPSLPEDATYKAECEQVESCKPIEEVIQ